MSFRVYIFLFLAVIFQLSLAWRLEVLAVAPNLVLAVVIALAITGDFKRIWPAFFGGLILDISAGRIFGVLVLSLLFCFVLTRWLAKNILKKSGFLSFFVLSAIGVLIFELTGFLFVKLAESISLTGYFLSAGDFFSRILPISFVLNAVLSGLIIFIFYKWNFFPKTEN